MRTRRLLHLTLACLILLTSGPWPVSLAASPHQSDKADISPTAPSSVPGTLPGPKPTINVNINHASVWQEVIVSGAVPSSTYAAVRIAWLINNTTYTAAIVNRDAGLNYTKTLKVPLTSTIGAVQICATVTGTATAEFACTAFTIDTPPTGSVSGSLPAQSLAGGGETTRNASPSAGGFFDLFDHSGEVIYSTPIGLDGTFSISGVEPGVYGYGFSGSVDPGLDPGRIAVDPGKDSMTKPISSKAGSDPVTGLPCFGNFDAQVGRAAADTSDSSFGYMGDYSPVSSFEGFLHPSDFLPDRGYDFGGYLQGVTLNVTFRSVLQINSGVTVDSVQYHIQKPDHTIVSIGSSSNASSNYSLAYNVGSLPTGKSKLIVAPVVSGVRQCPKSYSILVDADPMKDSRVQAGATTTWNGTLKVYQFQGTLINAGGLLPFTFPDPPPSIPLIGTVENTFNAGIHVEGEIRLNGVVHLKVMRALAYAKVFNHPLFDESQDLIDDSVAHVYTDLHDWTKTHVRFMPIKLWKDSFKTEVFNGTIATYWGIVSLKASVSVGLDGEVTVEGVIYPFQPNFDATLHTQITPSLSLSVWVELLFGVASAGADATATVGFGLPLRVSTMEPEHPEYVWIDTPCFSIKITLEAWARVNLIFWKKEWRTGSYNLVNYSNPSGCTALAQAIKEAAPDATVEPPRVIASPSVATSLTGQMLSVYIEDTTPAQTQSTPKVMARFWNPTLQVWETPLAVSDGLHNVQDPAAGYIGQTQTPIAIWTQTNLTIAQEEAAGDSMNAYLNKQEIYYSLWSGSAWGTPVRLTNDSLPDGRAAIGGDMTGATLAWTVNTSGVVTDTTSLRIRVTEWDPQNSQWGPISQLNGNLQSGAAMNAQVNVARGIDPNTFLPVRALAWTLDLDGDIGTNNDRHIVVARWSASDGWTVPSFDSMGSQPSGAESSSLSLDPLTGLLHLAFVVRGKDGDGTSDTGIGNRAVLYTGKEDSSHVWSYQSLTDNGAPVYAEKPSLLISSTGEEILIFRNFGEAGTNGILGQLAMAQMPAGGSSFSNPGYLTDDTSQHYQQSAAINPSTHSAVVLSVNRAAVAAGTSIQALNLVPSVPYSLSESHLQPLTTNGDPVEALAVSAQPDLAMDSDLTLSALHALPGASVTITTTLTNIGRGVATSEAGTPIQVCLYRGTSPSGNLVSCQDLLEGDQLNYNDTRQFAFSILANNGQQPVYATVSSHGYNGSTTNDVATGALGDIPAPQLTGVFVDGVLPQALDIQWMPPSVPGLGGYRILRSSTPGGPYELVGETTGTFLPDLLLTRGQEYCYVVQAYDSGGTVSPYSNEACGMVPLLSVYMPLVRR